MALKKLKFFKQNSKLKETKIVLITNMSQKDLMS